MQSVLDTKCKGCNKYNTCCEDDKMDAYVFDVPCYHTRKYLITLEDVKRFNKLIEKINITGCQVS